MNKKTWTPEEKERFREMCLAGTSNKELADAFGVTLASVHHKRSAWGLTMEKCAATKAAAGKEPIDDIPSPVKPILIEKGGKKKPSKKAAAKKAAAEEQTPPDEEEKIVIDAQAFFALAHELSENAETMEKLKTDNLELKTQLLNQSQLIAQQQDAIETLQIVTEQLCDHITDAEDEANNKSDFMARRGLSRLFRRYKPLKRLGTEDPDMKEAENAGND